TFFELANDLGSRYCTALPNSLGVRGEISAFGSSRAADNDVTLVASGLPPLQFGIFVVSANQGLQAVPNGGNLCLGGQIGRYQAFAQIFQVSPAGEGALRIDLDATPQPSGLVSIQSGQSWNFQGWYRDGGPTSATSNFTDGLEIAFL
ncbi:MAG: hypothetical protein AAFR54_22250, partial [Planctomycetota bacterium]